MFESRVLRKIFGPKTEDKKKLQETVLQTIASFQWTLSTVCNMSIFKRDDTSGAGSIPVFRLSIILCHFQLHFLLSRMLAHPVRHWAIMKAHFTEVDASMVLHMLQ
jgi:hypothetical protein